MNCAFALYLSIFLTDKILRPEMSVVMRDFRCGGVHKAYRYWTTTSRKAPLIGRFRRVRICTLWLSNRRSNTVRFRSSLFPCGIAFINHRRQPDGRFHAFPRRKMNGRNSSTLKIGKFFVFEVLSRRYTGVFQVAKR